jgi:hypothetical protein
MPWPKQLYLRNFRHVPKQIFGPEIGISAPRLAEFETSHIMVGLAAGPDGRSHPVEGWGRKVRTPQSSVPDNVREAGFKPVRRKVPQRIYRPGGNARVRVKRCGKSAPPRQ